MIGKTSILLISSIAMVLALSGSPDQKAFAFEPTEEELEVIQVVSELTTQLEELTYDDPNYWEISYQHYTAVRSLNDLGLYVEGQIPDLSHLTAQYNSTRAAAQAGINATGTEGGQSAPCYRCNQSSDDDYEKTIYVGAGFRELVDIWGLEIANYNALAISDSITSDETTSAKVSQKWSDIKNKIEPYCRVGVERFPTEAEYTLGIAVISDGIVYQNQSEEYSEVFYWWSPIEQHKGHQINNLNYGIDVVCSLTAVTLE